MDCPGLPATLCLEDDREPIGGDAEVGHECHVLFPAMEVIARHVAGVFAEGPTRLVSEAIPDGISLGIGSSPLDLIGRGGYSPQKRRRLAHRRVLFSVGRLKPG